MDRMAKDMLWHIVDEEITILESHKYAPLIPKVRGVPIYQNIFKTLYQEIADERLHKSWIEKG